MQTISTIPKQGDHEIDFSALDVYLMPPSPPPLPPPPPPPLPPPPPPPLLAVEKVIVEPLVPNEMTTAKHSTKTQNLRTSAKSFTIAFLQQCTNSFSPDDFIGSGMLGSVYRAQLPDGKVRFFTLVD